MSTVAPLPLDHDDAVCDNCFRVATLALPHARVCAVCVVVIRDDPAVLRISPEARRVRESEYRRIAAATETYDVVDEILLGSSIPPPYRMICDVEGCDRDADALVDGAVVCDECLTVYAREDGSLSIPFGDLRGDDDRRALRSRQYRGELARLVRRDPRPRTRTIDAQLARRLNDTVDAMVELSIGVFADDPPLDD